MTAPEKLFADRSVPCPMIPMSRVIRRVNILVPSLRCQESVLILNLVVDWALRRCSLDFEGFLHDVPKKSLGEGRRLVRELALSHMQSYHMMGFLFWSPSCPVLLATWMFHGTSKRRTPSYSHLGPDSSVRVLACLLPFLLFYQRIAK